MLEKQQKRYRRHRRVRAKIKGTAAVPRLCVFKSSNHIYAQLIDDKKGKTLFNASDLELGLKSKGKKTNKPLPGTKEKDIKTLSGKVAIGYEVGKLIAKKALEKKIEKVIFDRGGYKYHGRVKALADGARDAGLKF